MTDQKLYILMVSVHGLVRGHDMELGRDADTGGQITYVVELARALGHNNHIRPDRPADPPDRGSRRLTRLCS